MKLTFLGTSHGVPAADRYCSCTMLEIGGDIYLIDAGGPVIDMLLRHSVDLSRIRAIFTTHIHGDHINGLFAFVDLCNWYYQNTSIKIYLTEQAGIELLRQSIAVTEFGTLDEHRLQLLLMQQDMCYDDGTIRVMPIPTAHLSRFGHPAYAYLVEAEGKRVLFTGDMSNNLEEQDFPSIALREPLDLVISEMAHFGVEHLKPTLDAFCGKKLLFNHVFPLEKLDQIRTLQTAYPYSIDVLEDGDELTL